MTPDDYQQRSVARRSPHYFPERVSRTHLVNHAAALIGTLATTDRFKRTLFYPDAEPRREPAKGDTMPPLSEERAALLHMALGMLTEAGELFETVYHHVVFGDELDKSNLIEELGDLEWYPANLRDLLGVTQAEVQAANDRKLALRHGDTFSDTSCTRDLDAEREAVDLFSARG